MTSMCSPAVVCILEDSSRSGFGGGQRITSMVATKISAMHNDAKILVVDFGHNDYFKQRLPPSAVYMGSSEKKTFIARFVKYWLSVILINKRYAAMVYTTTRLSSAGIGMLRVVGGFKNVKWVVHEHMAAPKNVFIKALYTSLIQKADLHLYSSAVCQLSYKTRSSDIMTGYIGAEAALQIDSCGPDDERVKKGLAHMETKIGGSSKKPTRLLYAGKISEEKGIFELIQMFRKSFCSASTDGERASLTICGFGKQTMVNRMLKLIDGATNIIYVGCITPTMRIYSLYDVGIVPSWGCTESLGLSAIEFACHIGRALIHTNGDAFNRLYNLKGIERLKINGDLREAIHKVLSQEIVDKGELERAIHCERGDRYLREMLNHMHNC